MQDIYKNFGVKTEFIENGIRLTKSLHHSIASSFHFDFENCPDIAQTVAVSCAALNVEAKFTGLKTLRIKETDRIFALQQELTKLDFNVEVDGDDLTIIPSLRTESNEVKQSSSSSRLSCEGRNLYDWDGKFIETYDDHRMAMAFAPLALIAPITINDEDVVVKSYPDFWKDLDKVGFEIN